MKSTYIDCHGMGGIRDVGFRKRNAKSKVTVRHFVLSILLLFIMETPCLFAQWRQTNGPYGGDVTCLTENGTAIFAGTNGGGIFRSTDNGASWSAASTGLTNTNISALAVDGSDIFAGTTGNYHAGVFVSSDDGDTWTPASSGLTNPNITGFAVDGAKVFAATDNGLFISRNGGSSWSPVLKNETITSLAMDGSNLLAGAGDGLYRSTDDGATWTEIDSGMKGVIVNALAYSGALLFAGITIPQGVPVGGSYTPEGGVYVSSSNGALWTEVGGGLPDTPVNCLATNDGDVFAGTSAGVYISANAGANWTRADSGLTNTFVNAFMSYGADIFAATYGNVFISSNNGGSWAEAGVGIINTSVSALAVFDSTLYAGDNGILLSTDGGASWTAAGSGLPSALYVSSFVKSGSDIYAVMKFYRGILRSTDNGRDWTVLDSGSTGSLFTCLAVAGGNVIAGDGQSGHGVFVSTDNGNAWISRNAGLTNTWVTSLLAVPTATGGTELFAGTQDGGLFMSTDYGRSWSLQSNDLSDEIVFSMASVGSRLFAGTNNGVYVSSDNGINWIHIGPPNGYVTSLAASGADLFAGCIYDAYSDGGVYLTTDNGTSWRSVDSGLVNTDIAALAIDSSHLYAGTYGSGTWTLPLSDVITSVEPPPAGSPTAFSLSQNYPNPFNPATNIEFRVAKVEYVSLKVYDVLGRDVRVLVGKVEKPGSYSLTFNAGDLPSGVYFYRMSAGDFSATKKFILIK